MINLTAISKDPRIGKHIAYSTYNAPANDRRPRITLHNRTDGELLLVVRALMEHGVNDETAVVKVAAW